MKTSDLDIIVEHALSDENKLSVALDVAFAFPEIRRRLIVEATANLESLIKQEFSTSRLLLDNQFREFPLAIYTGFWVKNAAWPEGYRVGFEAQASDARNICFGMVAPRESLRRSELKRLLDEAIKPGRYSKDWPWFNDLSGYYGSWDNKEALLALHDNSSAGGANELFSRLVAIINVVDQFFLD